MKLAFSVVILGIAACTGALAQQPNSGFYVLTNKVSGKVACAQHPPTSPNWVRQPGGPFLDSDCKIVKPETTRKYVPPASPLDPAPKK